MKRCVMRFITCLGLAFFFTLLIPFLAPGSVASATVVSDNTQSEQTVSGQIVSNMPSGSTEGTESGESVEDPKLQIKLNVKTKALVKEKSYALKVYNVTDNHSILFKSDNPDIASVNEEGLVTANAVGTTFVTVTVKEGAKVIATLRCDITVGPPAVSIKLVRSEITLSVGKKTTLKTILQPNNTVEEAKFCSYDPEIAAVSAGGRIVAKKAGTTYIYVGIDNGKYDLCKVIVVEGEVSDESESSDLTTAMSEATTPAESQNQQTEQSEQNSSNVSAVR